MAARLCVIAITLAIAACQLEPPRPLTPDDRRHVEQQLDYARLPQPTSLTIESNGFIVADYELSPDQVRARQPLSKFGEACLLAIREALLESGYRDYRVNVNGLPPGTGLTARYGSARFIDAGGRVEWLTP